MKKANHNHKDLIVALLSRSFDDNKSVNYIVQQDVHRERRIKALMAYSYEIWAVTNRHVYTVKISRL